jgi:hypothetical protein
MTYTLGSFFIVGLCLFVFCFCFLVFLGGVSPLGTSATVGLLYQPRMIYDDDYGAVGGMRIGRGNRSTRRKPAPVPLCPPQVPHDLTWDRTRAAAVGSQRLTAWAMERPRPMLLHLQSGHCPWGVLQNFCLSGFQRYSFVLGPWSSWFVCSRNIIR